MVTVPIAPIVAANSAANSAAAAQRAEALRVACMKFAPGYQHDTATVAEARQYADCIEILYPPPMDHTGIVLTKITIVAVLIGACIGFVRGWKEFHDTFGIVAGMFLGGILGLFAVFAVVGTIAGIGFLFS